MSEMRQQGGSASGRLEASRQSLGVVLRGVVGIFVLERQPQGRGSMRPMRYGVPAGNAGLQSRLGAAHFAYSADSAWTVGRATRVAVRRVMMHKALPNNRRHRTPRVRSVCILLQWRGVAAADRSLLQNNRPNCQDRETFPVVGC
jgi:hypothetical protein